MEIMETNQGNERLTKVETKVDNITVELTGMWKALRDIQDSLNRSGKTDWMTLIALCGFLLTLIGCLWAAAIHPISADVERAAMSADKLATAVLIQNDKVASNASDLKALKADVDRTAESAGKIAAAVLVQNDKFTATSTKVELIESKLEALEILISHINAHGTVDSDKRLSLIEAKLMSKP
jgi:tetrahydromethanopterin S-methyltransferase subunit G